MSHSPFQNPPASENAPGAPSPRRLQSPAERFGAEKNADAAELPWDQSLAPQEEPRSWDEPSDEAPEPAPAPDPFERLPRARAQSGSRVPRNRRGVEMWRARRRLKQHAPHYHEKKPHVVAHKPIKAAGETTPPNSWDRAAQNSMARAALARKRGRVRRIVGRIALAASVLFTVWAGATALTAPQFEVQHVEITGTKRTTSAQTQALTGQLIGRNVFRAPVARVAGEIEKIPTVAQARVTRTWSWPPHLKVQIIERQPLVQVGAGTTWWVADAQGVAFRRADHNDAELYRLTSPQLQPVTGKALPAAPFSRARQIVAALAADNALVARETGATQNSKFWDLRRIYLDANGAAALRISAQGPLKLHGETLIRLGEEGWPTRLKQARIALNFFERTGRKTSEVDLVSSEHPRWRPGAEPTPEAQNGEATGR